LGGDCPLSDEVDPDLDEPEDDDTGDDSDVDESNDPF